MNRAVVLGALAAATAIFAIPAPAGVAAAPFPDVPPWHWAHDAVQKGQDAGIVIGYPASPSQLVENSLFQVYDAFAHAGQAGAQAWAERFTYNRPAGWPQPLERSQLTQFVLRNVRVAVRDDTATATFTAAVMTRRGPAVANMRVVLRRAGDDWQVDYAGLAAGSALFP